MSFPCYSTEPILIFAGHCRRKREIGDFGTIGDDDGGSEFGITDSGDYDCCGPCPRRQDTEGNILKIAHYL